MKIYVNKLPPRVPSDEEYKDYTPVFEFKNIFLQFTAYFLGAIAVLGIVVLVQKYIFGLPVRKAFSPADFDLSTALLSMLTLVLLRFIIRAITLVSKDYAKGFHLKSLSIFNFTKKPLGKTHRIISILAPLIVITLFCLTMMKIKGHTGIYFYMYMLYVNGAVSCYDMINAIIVGMTVKGSKTLDWGRGLYVSESTNKPEKKESLPSDDSTLKISEDKDDKDELNANLNSDDNSSDGSDDLSEDQANPSDAK